MKLIYEKSSGDVTLYKFVMYKIPKIDGFENNYDEQLQAYLFIEPYTYNIHTKETDDKYITHADIIDDIVPYEIKRAGRDRQITGKTDCYMPYKGEQNPIRLWFSGNTTLLTNVDKQYLKRMFNADYVK
jgi:hypothetical protein